MYVVIQYADGSCDPQTFQSKQLHRPNTVGRTHREILRQFLPCNVGNMLGHFAGQMEYGSIRITPMVLQMLFSLGPSQRENLDSRRVIDPEQRTTCFLEDYRVCLVHVAVDDYLVWSCHLVIGNHNRAGYHRISS